MKLNRRVILTAVTGLFFALIVSVACGLLDLLAKDDRVARGEAIGSLAAYWLLTTLAIIVVAFAARHWRDLLLALVALLIAGGIAEAALRLLGTPWGMRRFAAVRSTEYHHIYPPNRDMFQGVYDGHPWSFVPMRTVCEPAIPASSSAATTTASSY
jgi:hypothetical protein